MREHTIDEITAILASVEAAVPAHQIREVVDLTLPKHPPALRALDALKRDGGLLTEGSPFTPPALEKIIARLLAVGATSLCHPRCAACGMARRLVKNTSDGRLCNSCAHPRHAVTEACSGCAQTKTIRCRVGEAMYCRQCWHEGTANAPREVFSAIMAHQHLDSATVSTALNALGASPDRQLRLALEIRLSGAEWFTDPAAGSRQFAAFYDSLRGHGANLPERVCGHCGQPGKLNQRLHGRISCRKCYRAGHERPCSACGQKASIERILPTGDGLCQRCTNSLDDEWAHCSDCGIRRLIAARTADGPLCSTCRARAKMDTCSACGQNAPCRFAGSDEAICGPCRQLARIDTCTLCGNRRSCRWAATDKAICEQCANPREPCSACGEIRLRHKRLPDGGLLCWACTPPIIEPCTACGQDRIVNGRIDDAPYCPLCYPQQPESFKTCNRCATVARLNRAGLCPGCRAADAIDELIPPAVADSEAGLAALRAACLAGPPDRVLFALEQGTVSHALLHRLVREPHNRTHGFLDGAAPEQTTRSARALLADYGLLPPRDELLARFEIWIESAAKKVNDPTERKVFTQFARWRHLRRLRQMPGPTRTAQLEWRRRELTAVVDLLAWTRNRGRSLSALSQSDVDSWMAEGRHTLTRFLTWSNRSGHTKRLTAPNRPKAQLDTTGWTDEERWAPFADVIADKGMDAHTRLAAGLLLLFGIRAVRIVQLHVSDVVLAEGIVRVRLGRQPLVLPGELSEAAAAAVLTRTAPRMLTETIDEEWLFPGARSGHHLTAEALNLRLRRLGIDPRRARAGALVALAQQLPPSVLSALTGLEITSCVRWSDAVAASRANYAALKIPALS